MLFTEPAFLFLFLPGLLGAYFLVPNRWRNLLLTGASLLFYGFGEYRFLPLLVLSIAVNYVFAIWIERKRTSRWHGVILGLGIASDLALLLIFKYAGWFVESVNVVLALLSVQP
ncbi:MAG: alginate O-acetyltransferase complex protein AlgI, partial [Myxococcales bacterium]|nr:alginate O-acetyltransferase complex protein AlgI [Myxococcales bacterium]